MIKKIDSKRQTLVVPQAQGGKVLKSCVRCRQHKTKCDAEKTNPLACSNCSKRNIQCTLDIIIKKSDRSHQELVEKLTVDISYFKTKLDGLIDRNTMLFNSLAKKNKVFANIITNNAIAYTPEVSVMEDAIPLDESLPITPQPINDAYFVCDANKSVPPFSILIDEAHILLKNYELHFNKYLPIFPEDFFNTINFLTFIQENGLLFWCIMLISYLNNPLKNSHKQYSHLSAHIQSLVVEKCWLTTPRSVYTVSALLILTTWPLPNNKLKISDNLAVKFTSITKSLSYQFGLHKLEFISEFSHGTTISVSNDVNLNNLIRERIYKFININSNFWLICLGLSNNAYNGFNQDYIINRATNVDIKSPKNDSDHYINSLLKVSTIQSKLNENMNDLIGNSDIRHLLPNQVNISQLINLNMFEVILDDFRSDNPLINLSIEYSKLQVFIYAFSPHNVTIGEYKQFIAKMLISCFKILHYVENFDMNQLPIHYKFPIELVAMILIRIFKSPILSSLKDYEIIKQKFNRLVKLLTTENWLFMNDKLFKILKKFDAVDNMFIANKAESFFLVSKMKNYLVSSLNYELIWLIYENENDSDGKIRPQPDLSIYGANKEVLDYIQKNESIFEVA